MATSFHAFSCYSAINSGLNLGGPQLVLVTGADCLANWVQREMATGASMRHYLNTPPTAQS
jgi:hypothetical protein